MNANDSLAKDMEESAGLLDAAGQHPIIAKELREGAAALRTHPPAGGAVSEAWRCFYCDEVFTDRVAAYEHFGAATEGDDTACKLTKDEKGLVGLLREAYDEIRRYQAEDTALVREVHGLGAKHEREKREQEETGYARGLADGRALSTPAASGTEHKTSLGKIITEYVFPPIPPRQFDWAAYRDGYEPGCKVGHGKTEAEAVADLFATEEE